MIDLRWIFRNGQKVLQYRFKEFQGWSDWKDVRTVGESD